MGFAFPGVSNPDYSTYIHLSRYSRWLEHEKRRERWPETVARYCDFWKKRFDKTFPYETVYNAVLNLEVMPSMRCLMTAGRALERDEMAGFNCSALPIDHVRAFDETVYILMCGTGVGFSVEKKFTARLPIVGYRIENGEPVFCDQHEDTDYVISVADSKIGWASSYRELLGFLYSGYVPKWDLSKIRPAGAPLKTMGGRASGPDPLDALFRFTVDIFRKACGRKLSCLEVHDVICKIADIVVVGGVRRSALISLSDLTDVDIRNSKSGAWFDEPDRGIYRHGYRALANNSAVYDGRPSMSQFFDEWGALYKSGSGERGIFNRAALRQKVLEAGVRESDHAFLTNPCGEIILRPYGLCNLSEVVIRASDDEEDMKRKTEIAAIIGTFQSTLTNFRYVRDIWRKNAEDERLLGVSMTGIMDNDHLNLRSSRTHLKALLARVRDVAWKTNGKWAKELGVNESKAITTVKPSGTVSQLVDSASGIHPRHAKYYIRRVMTDSKDPLRDFMTSTGFPAEDSKSKPGQATVFSFPMKAPDAAVTREHVKAIDQLEHYLTFRDAWCDHNPSITISIRDPEWLDVGAWVYKHFENIGGVSFLPYSEHIYQQAPYEDIDKEKYDQLTAEMPKNVNWDLLTEKDGLAVTGLRELSCVSGVCEVSL